MKRDLFKLVAMGLSLLVFNSCGGKGSQNVWESADGFESGAKLKIAATTTMVQDLVKVIGGDDVEIYGVMGEGVDPHSYSSRSSDRQALKSADLVFYNGLHLEETLQKNIELLKTAHRVTSGMEKSELVQPEEKYSAYADPHVWGDPLLWSKTIDVVVDALVAKDAKNGEKYKERGDAYRKELMDLSEWAKGRMREVPAERRILVTSHDAFMYYARAFDFEVKAIDGLAPGDKSGPKKVEELVAFIRERQLKMIFPESAANKKGIEAIAKDAGVAVSDKELYADATGKVGELETVNGETYDLGSYIGMIKHNVNAIVEGLK